MFSSGPKLMGKYDKACLLCSGVWIRMFATCHNPSERSKYIGKYQSILRIQPSGLHKLWNPAIQDGRTRSKFGEHGKYDCERFIYDSKHSIATQNTLLVNQMTQNTIFYGIFGEGWQIHIGEHDPGSAQDWRTSTDLRRPASHKEFFCQPWRMISFLAWLNDFCVGHCGWGGGFIKEHVLRFHYWREPPGKRTRERCRLTLRLATCPNLKPSSVDRQVSWKREKLLLNNERKQANPPARGVLRCKIFLDAVFIFGYEIGVDQFEIQNTLIFVENFTYSVKLQSQNNAVTKDFV